MKMQQIQLEKMGLQPLTKTEEQDVNGGGFLFGNGPFGAAVTSLINGVGSALTSFVSSTTNVINNFVVNVGNFFNGIIGSVNNFLTSVF